MGSENSSNPSKLHYDITMSKRTRKPPNHLAKRSDDQKNYYPFKASSPEEEQNPTKDVNEEEEEEHKSLKELIKERSPLGQHFTEEEEEKQQQQHHLQVLAVKHHDEENLEGLTLKRLVRRYARVLSRLIKVKKQDSRMGMASRNKPPLRFTK